jgi:hypothetical protein
MRASLDGAGCLAASDGSRFPPLAVTAEMVINRTTVIYGPSGSGKTVIAKHLLQVVKEQIPQVLVVSPSEPSNHSYEGYVDAPLVHYSLALPGKKRTTPKRDAIDFLDTLWKRQELLTSIFSKANRREVLASLFKRLPRSARKRGLKAITEAHELRRGALDKVRAPGAPPGPAADKAKAINEKFDRMLVLIYKSLITPEYLSLWELDDLSADERFSLNYLGLNPNLLLIFDDCAADLKPLFGTTEFKRYFYQARHAAITVILIAQDDTDLPTNLRKNAFLSIFTDPIVCRSNFDRASNNFPKEARALVGEMIPAVFAGNRKLVYIRDDPRQQKYYHFEAPYPTPFRFGSSASHELCRLLRAEEADLDDENPYSEAFVDPIWIPHTIAIVLTTTISLSCVLP